jgi:hypothetical protein
MDASSYRNRRECKLKALRVLAIVAVAVALGLSGLSTTFAVNIAEAGTNMN